MYGRYEADPTSEETAEAYIQQLKRTLGTWQDDGAYQSASSLIASQHPPPSLTISRLPTDPAKGYTKVEKWLGKPSRYFETAQQKYLENQIDEIQQKTLFQPEGKLAKAWAGVDKGNAVRKGDSPLSKAYNEYQPTAHQTAALCQPDSLR